MRDAESKLRVKIGFITGVCWCLVIGSALKNIRYMTIKASFGKVTVYRYKSEICAHCSRYLIGIERFQVFYICKLSLNYLNQLRTNWTGIQPTKYPVTAIEFPLVADGTTPTAL